MNEHFEIPKPKLDKVIFHFSQEANGDDEDEYESLEIRCQSSLGIDNDDGKCYYVLNTEQWSMDSLDELQDLINRMQKSIKNE